MVSQTIDGPAPKTGPLWLRIPAWGRWGAVILFNTLIALFLTAIEFGGSLPVNWLFSQCVGLTIATSVELALRFLHSPVGRAVGLAVAVVVGSMLGTALALLVTGVYEVEDLVSLVFVQAVLIGLVFGTAMTLFAYGRERALRSEQALDAARLRQLGADKARVEAELRMLQAQVEPHFLFNTLAIVRGQIGKDPQSGKQLLDHLIEYLRASLSHSRSERATLGEELELLEHYLNIMQIRMGERLAFSIEAPEYLRGVPLPPMLLQPLVENAIRHGLEPKTGAGQLRIEVTGTSEGILVQVSDDGVGFSSDTTPGNGLANIRARLQALYEGRAQLAIEDNEQGGVTATLRLPYP